MVSPLPPFLPPSLAAVADPIFMSFLSIALRGRLTIMYVYLHTLHCQCLTYLLKDPLDRDLHFLIFTLFKCIKLTDRL